MSELATAFAALVRWCSRHNIGSAGIEVSIEMPNASAKYRAEAAFDSDFRWLNQRPVGAISPNKLYGIQFKFTSREKEAAE